jgi:hypothetical protein
MFRTVFRCGCVLLAACLFSMGRQSGSAGYSYAQKPAQAQKPISKEGVKGSKSSFRQEQWNDLQKQQVQVQQQWLDIQRQQLELQKAENENLQLLNNQQQRQPGFWDRFWQVLPSLITALMALMVSLIALNFNHWSTRRTARQDHIRMLMDIDKELIQRPYLWTVYGQNPEPAEGMEEKLKDLLTATRNYRELQEDALMYAFFNMFEAVYEFHRHLGLYGWRRIPRAIASKLMFWSDRRKVDEEHKESWDRFATDFFSDEKGRRSWKLFNRQRNLYTVSFQEWVDKYCKRPPTESQAQQTTDAPPPAAAATPEIPAKAPPPVSGAENTGNGSTKPQPPAG